MADSCNKQVQIAKDLGNIFESVTTSQPAAIARTSTPQLKLYGRKWVLVKFEDYPNEAEIFQYLNFCGIIADQHIDECEFWSIVAWYCRVDRVAFKAAATNDGYDFHTIKFADVAKPSPDWALDNFASVPVGIALHVVGALYTTLLGKIINDNNIKYVSTRIERMRGIVSETGIKSDWVSAGHCQKNFVAVTNFMNGTPHIRAVIFNAFKERKLLEPFLPQLTTHVMSLLNGSFMTSQILIVMELTRRAEIVALFTDLRYELVKFSKWLDNLTPGDRRELGYLRLKYGEDKTQMVSLREMQLCSYVAYGLARNTTSTLDYYTGFVGLDERKKAIGDKIIKWILEIENNTASQQAYAERVGISPEQHLGMINELKRQMNKPTGAGGIGGDDEL